MNRKITFSIDEFYHCYNRGTDKRKIFLDSKDYLRFTLLLYVCNSTEPIHISNFGTKNLIDLFRLKRGKPLVAIGAYCLMPNHFHLLIKEIKEGGISLFVQKVLTAYSMYFNKKHQRRGSLFESRFKAEHASEDRYLKYLFSYIHLNPVKLIDPKWKELGLKNSKKTTDFLDDYENSSYLDYQGIDRPQNEILNMDEFPIYFEKPEDFKSEIFDWLSYGKV